MNIKNFIYLLKISFKSWKDDKVPQLSAALAYYTLFSLAPLLIIILAIIGFFFGAEAAQGQLSQQIQGTIGKDASQMVEEMIKNSSNKRSNIVATIIGVVTLILGASGVFGQLQDSLNIIWNVKPKPKQSILYMVKTRFLSFSLVLSLGFLLLVSLVISAGISALGAALKDIFPLPIPLVELINSIISIGIITLLFAIIFKFLPNVRITWKDVFIGALMTGILFTLGKYGLGLYLGRSSATSTYGAAGSLIIILLWAYYSSQILFFGAEFTKSYATKFGSCINPDKHAIAVENEPTPLEELRKKQASDSRYSKRKPYELIPYGATIVGFILGLFIAVKKEKKKK